mmetsp:Transcript_12275/g.29827  ORF Transcript_12275/g.29827 Transcript_12275/m.29827 type:complete len:152 (+) Transcript_12275:255-710(+)
MRMGARCRNGMAPTEESWKVLLFDLPVMVVEARTEADEEVEARRKDENESYRCFICNNLPCNKIMPSSLLMINIEGSILGGRHPIPRATLSVICCTPHTCFHLLHSIKVAVPHPKRVAAQLLFHHFPQLALLAHVELPSWTPTLAAGKCEL